MARPGAATRRARVGAAGRPPRVRHVRGARHDQAHRCVASPASQMLDQVQGRRPGFVDLLEHEHQRLTVRPAGEHPKHGLEGLEPLEGGIGPRRRWDGGDDGRQSVGQLGDRWRRASGRAHRRRSGTGAPRCPVRGHAAPAVQRARPRRPASPPCGPRADRRRAGLDVLARGPSPSRSRSSATDSPRESAWPPASAGAVPDPHD